MQTHPIWQKLDEMFENEVWTKWLTPVMTMCSDGVKFEELARSSKTLADLYASSKKPNIRKRAIGYGLLTGLCHMKASRMAAAMAMCDWLRAIPDSRGVVEFLESEVSRAICNAPTSKIETPDAPTSVQNVEVINQIRANFKNEKQLPYPKATYPLLSELPLDEVNTLIQKARVRELKENEVLFSEGDTPDSFYLVAEGQLQLASEKGFKKVFEEGEFFGELGVLGNMNRTATARSTQKATVIEFSKALLIEAFIKFPNLEQKILRYFYLRLFLNMVRNDSLFQDIPEKDYLEFFYTFTPMFAKTGQCIFKQGDFSDSFFYLLSGHWEVQKQDGSKILQGPGDFVGERGFLHKKPRNASVFAKTDCHFLRCDDGMFKSFGKSFPKIETLLRTLADQRRDPAQSDPAQFIA